MFLNSSKYIRSQIVFVALLIVGLYGPLPVRAKATDVSLFQLTSNTAAFDWHTFYGPAQVTDVTVDSNGNIYLVGFSGLSWNGPGSTPPINAYTGGSDIVVIKLDRNGIYQWHTFYGSIDNDNANSIVVDSNGNIYIGGQSASTWNGPGSTSPLNSFAGGGDMVLVKLDSAGIYQWHTFYGAATTIDRDEANSIGLDSNGNIYMVGFSRDTWNGPGAISPLNNFAGDYDIVIIKLNNSGSYQWHTFYGSASSDFPNDVSVDDGGNVYIAGQSSATWNGPASVLPLHAYTSGSLGNIVVMKVDTNGNYQWHTFYGSGENAYAAGISIDLNGNIYIAGGSSANWYGPNSTPPLHAHAGGTSDVVILKLNNSGIYQWHTFYGSSASDTSYDIKWNTNGNISVVGSSFGAWNGPGSIPPLNAFTNGQFGFESDIVIVTLDSDGLYQWHAFYGSSNADWAEGVSATPCGTYIAGTSRASWDGPGNTPPLNAAYSDSYNIVAIKMITAIGKYTVTNTNDSGAGSLRQAVIDACPGDHIIFDSSLSGQTIVLSSTLAINKDITIDGSSLASHIKLDGASSLQTLIGIQGNVNIKNVDFLNAEYGIYQISGNLSILNSLFSGNSVTGILSSTQLTVTTSTFSGNSSGIENFGVLSVDNSTFTNNSSRGIYNEKAPPYYVLGEATVVNSTFTLNHHGGGIQNQNGTLTVSDSSFVSNDADNYGGGIWNNGTATVTSSQFVGNSAPSGGGIQTGGLLTVTSSTFSSNSASNNGGGITGFGGLTISDSTFTGNSAVNNGGAVIVAEGLDMSNTTFYNNSASLGGGLYIDFPSYYGPSHLSNNTVTNNSGSGLYINNGNIQLSNNILANSVTGSDCYVSAVAVFSGGNNLIENNSILPNSCGTPVSTADPLLGPLANNGGFTQTMALLSGSSAIDAGDDTVCSASPVNGVDQRGVTRPFGSHCDIGAYENDSAFIDVTMGGNPEGSYVLASGEEKRLNYPLSAGPVVVHSTNAIDLASAIRLQSYANGRLYSFVETMGVPSGLLSYKYYFPTYNNTWGPLNSQLRFANINNTDITVKVTIGNTSWNYDVPANSERREYLAVSDGPVIIESTDPSKQIIAAIRLQSFTDGTLYSFAETLGIPAEQLSYKYYFPTYNNTWGPLNSQLRFANINDTDITVKVTIGNMSWNYDVLAHSERRETLPVSGGPVIIESTDNTKPIIAAIRLQSYAGGRLYSFVETMGVPDSLLSYKYYFPTYNNTWAPLNSQLRFANINDTDITVKVTIGNTFWLYDVPAHSERREYLAVSGGPVIIESTDNTKPIIAAIRLQSFANSTLYSFSETMGVPVEQVSDTYYFPTYNNTWTPLNSQLRFGVP